MTYLVRSRSTRHKCNVGIDFRNFQATLSEQQGVHIQCNNWTLTVCMWLISYQYWIAHIVFNVCCNFVLSTYMYTILYKEVCSFVPDIIMVCAHPLHHDVQKDRICFILSYSRYVSFWNQSYSLSIHKQLHVAVSCFSFPHRHASFLMQNSMQSETADISIQLFGRWILISCHRCTCTPTSRPHPGKITFNYYLYLSVYKYACCEVVNACCVPCYLPGGPCSWKQLWFWL